MTMNKELHPRSDTARIYLSRKKGERGLMSVGKKQFKLVCKEFRGGVAPENR